MTRLRRDVDDLDDCRLVIGAFHVDDGRPSSEQDVCDPKLPPLAGIDVSVDEFGGI
jgi:hypothetical protein